ncbi:MAG: alpha/beta fold hydrolase [Gammaproteobacteria bacterium]
MIENNYYSQDEHGPTENFALGNFELEDGGSIPNCQLAYAEFGALNDDKSNAILIPTWFSGTNKIMEQVYIGEGRALDPSKYFIVCINQLGNGMSSSPHNSPDPISMANFPNVRIGDDVRAQHQMLTELYGLEELALVVGGSMGAQQTYEWAVRYPSMVKRAAAIAGTAKNTDHDFLFTQTLMDAITSDPGWNGGNYQSNEDVKAGLKRHAGIWSVMGLSTEFFQAQFWREFGFDTVEAFQTEFMEGLFCMMDPNALLAMAWKWQRGDVSRHTGGDLAAALARITAKTFVLPIDEDMFFPPRDCAREQAMIPNSEFRIINSICGHLGLFGAEPAFSEQIDKHLGDLLACEV